MDKPDVVLEPESEPMWTPELVQKLPALCEQMNVQAHEINELQMVNAFLEDKLEQLEGKLLEAQNALSVARGRIAQMQQDREFEG